PGMPMTVRHEGAKGGFIGNGILTSSHAALEMRAGPLEAGVQAQVSNHLKLRGSRARVVSVEEKAGHDPVR
ncbi:MAG: hypothetical protein ACREKR_14870, partial [Candidatus Methylomirabilales bacterium]